MATGDQGSRLLYSRGHVRLAGGDAVRARCATSRRCGRREERSGIDNPAVADAGVGRARAGRSSASASRRAELAEEELAAARSWGAPSAISFALRAVGIAEGGDEADRAAARGGAVVEGSPARYERARSLTEFGAALRRAGRRRDAREPLREALELADRCGAIGARAAAHEELLAAGARPRRTALSGVDSLTPSERRVASWPGRGSSNREIAQALFVTVRTVERHLTQAYLKLGIARREELPPALREDVAPASRATV